jgi:hypothetical protein
VWGRQLLAGSSAIKRLTLVAANAKQPNVRTRQQHRCAALIANALAGVCCRCADPQQR